MKKKWFKAKRFGYGWYPATWQGWLILLGYVVFAIYIAFSIENGSEAGIRKPIMLFINMLLATLLLIGVCFETGEKAKWNWGERKK